MKKPAKKPTHARGKAPLSARNADKHRLYQLSVQDADSEVAFIDRVFRKARGRAPESLREDFCGTALLTACWVKSNERRTGIGIDIDASVLAWGKRHNLSPLDEPGRRVALYRQDVRARVRQRVDVICAFNFSYWVFKTRDEMRTYLERARTGLKRDGLLMLDAYGGWEAQEPMLERRVIKGGFTYVWDQDVFDPITHRVQNHIHFHFRDGTKLRRAFTYDWRYWSLPELREILEEAGYSQVDVYWDISDDVNRDDYRVRQRAANQPGWLAYLVAAP